MVSMAARECFAGAPGPSYLEIPRDILDREISVENAVIPESGNYRASTRSIGDPADIEKLAEMLVNTSMVRPAACCRRVIHTISTEPDAMHSTRPTSSSLSVHRLIFEWGTASD